MIAGSASACTTERDGDGCPVCPPLRAARPASELRSGTSAARCAAEVIAVSIDIARLAAPTRRSTTSAM